MRTLKGLTLKELVKSLQSKDKIHFTQREKDDLKAILRNFIPSTYRGVTHQNILKMLNKDEQREFNKLSLKPQPLHMLNSAKLHYLALKIFTKEINK